MSGKKENFRLFGEKVVYARWFKPFIHLSGQNETGHAFASCRSNMKHTAIRTKSNQIVSFLFAFVFAALWLSLCLTKYISDLLDIVRTGAEMLKNDEHNRRTDSSVATVVKMTKRKKINKFT